MYHKKSTCRKLYTSSEITTTRIALNLIVNPVASLASSQPPPLPLTLSALVEILAAETSPRFDFLLLYAEWLKNASWHTVELRRPRYATGFFANL